MNAPRRERRNADPALNDPERLYVITGDLDGSERAALDLVTMVVAQAEPSPTFQPEQAAILRLCQAPCPSPRSPPISASRSASSPHS